MLDNANLVRTKCLVFFVRGPNLRRSIRRWCLHNSSTIFVRNFKRSVRTDLASFSIRFIEIITILPFSIRGASVSSVIFALNAGRLLAYVFGMLCKFEFKELNKNEIEHSD